MGTPKTTPSTTQQHEEDSLDEALEESFPRATSRTPAVRTATKPVKPAAGDPTKQPPPQR